MSVSLRVLNGLCVSLMGGRKEPPAMSSPPEDRSEVVRYQSLLMLRTA